MAEKTKLTDTVTPGLIARPGLDCAVPIPYATYEFVCVGPDGQEKWRDGFTNLVTTVGKNNILDQYFTGSGYTAAWYVGLKGAGSAAAGDTSASHAGWSEVTAYSNANRVTLSLNAASSGSMTSSAAASFNINGTATVAGAFLITENTKGGTTGTLYSAGDFTASRSVASGDTLNVNVTLTAS